MDRGAYISGFSIFGATLLYMSIDISYLQKILVSVNFHINWHDFFVGKTIPKESILSYTVTGIFGAIAIVFGNIIISYRYYINQLNELKRILSSLIDDQTSTLSLLAESLIRIRHLLSTQFS